MNCAQCDNPLELNARFCGNCGAPITTASPLAAFTAASGPDIPLQDQPDAASLEPPQAQAASVTSLVLPTPAPSVQQADNASKQSALVALVFGILSVIIFMFINGLLALPCAVVAIVLGVKASKKGVKGYGLTAIILGSLVWLVLLGFFVYFLFNPDKLKEFTESVTSLLYAP